MESDPLLIDDGYTQTRTIDPVPGLHPKLVIMYRPALSRERTALRLRQASGDPVVVENSESDLFAKYLVSINGTEYKDRAKITRLKPQIRTYLTDLILGYSPADEDASAKN